MKFPHCERLSLEKKMDFATDKCLFIWEDYGFDQFLGVGGHSAAAGETIGTEWGRRIYHNKLEIGIIEPVGKMGLAFAAAALKNLFLLPRRRETVSSKAVKCGLFLKVKCAATK